MSCRTSIRYPTGSFTVALNMPRPLKLMRKSKSRSKNSGRCLHYITRHSWRALKQLERNLAQPFAKSRYSTLLSTDHFPKKPELMPVHSVGSKKESFDMDFMVPAFAMQSIELPIFWGLQRRGRRFSAISAAAVLWQRCSVTRVLIPRWDFLHWMASPCVPDPELSIPVFLSFC